ncbi:hypothetical protein COX00_04595 [Candidatus Uhrbacteria bacterium CG22_combo_CG10-13_8_21_14_all_47_17]|uniref:Uncharacterized protein n=1 Tax=Candidatus Uhrbacteria bacterium CG22_combo_CG10-13_8_21_14_all_47_17 TaxID=1975041 RepID=A0A2H0BR74_9BACT|nr:MAG: hypothetical protein COX00_04595 [Candidatus Uhrbacteria bacterium CG22_combo_CG10-13_8_21_14_all_47_17]
MNLQSRLISAILERDAVRTFDLLKQIDKILTRALLGTFSDRPDASVPQVRQEIQDSLTSLNTDRR